jgi:hypothetical protein
MGTFQTDWKTIRKKRRFPNGNGKQSGENENFQTEMENNQKKEKVSKRIGKQ